MAYTLNAVIGAFTRLPAQIAAIPGGRRVELNQGFGLIPVPSGRFDQVSDGALGFRCLPPGLDRILGGLAPIAYVEAELFGGWGTQRAVVWQPDGIVVGPLLLDEEEPFPPEGSPISRALRALGAGRGDCYDEFEAVGLKRHRATEDWLS